MNITIFLGFILLLVLFIVFFSLSIENGDIEIRGTIESLKRETEEQYVSLEDPASFTFSSSFFNQTLISVPVYTVDIKEENQNKITKIKLPLSLFQKLKNLREKQEVVLSCQKDFFGNLTAVSLISPC